MTFWSLAFKWNWVTAEKLKGAVITETNRFGKSHRTNIRPSQELNSHESNADYRRSGSSCS